MTVQNPKNDRERIKQAAADAYRAARQANANNPELERERLKVVEVLDRYLYQ